MNFIISFTLSVAAGVVSYYICKWLDEQFKAADDEVAHIIAANLGRSGKSAVAVASPKVGSQQAVQAVQAQKHASAPVQPAVQAPVVQ